MSELDPFTKVYNALTSMVYTHPAVIEATKVLGVARPGNLVAFNTAANRDPVKQDIAVADLPELILVPEGSGEINLHGNSSGSKICRQFSFLISTGDFRVTSILLPVEWAVVCALTQWKSALGALQWNSKSYVKRCDVISSTCGQADAERNKRGLQGWSAVWRGEVEMWFTTADMLAFNGVNE